MIKRICIKILRILFDYSDALIGPKVEEILSIEEIFVGRVKLRIYKPYALSKKLSVVVYYHGGGWIIGSLKAYERILRYICHHSGSIVVGVEYRKAPEYKFPAAVDDAICAYEWVVNNISKYNGDVNKIIIAGDSAGGNLASVVTHHAYKTYLLKPIMQILIYPILDVRIQALKAIKNHKRRLIRKYGYYVLYCCLRQYLNSMKEIKSPNISPDLKVCNLGGIKTLLITCEVDSLAASAIEYANMLKQNNYHIIHKHYPNTVHGFIQFAGIARQARKALNEIARFIKMNV